MNENTNTPDNNDNNVIPPNELERRRRVAACIQDLADLSKDAVDRVLELSDLGVPAQDWVPLLAEHGSQTVQDLVQRYGGFAYGFIDGFIDARAAGAKTGVEGVLAGIVGHASRQAARVKNAPEGEVVDEELSSDTFYGFDALRMKKLIERLFADAPKMTDGAGKPDPSQAPALSCQIMLKAGGAIQGALSVTPEGTLRMMSPNVMNQKPVMVEHFFDYEQVADIAVFREVKASEGPRIITS